MRHKALIVLEALLMEIPVKMDGYEWSICDGVLGVPLTKMVVQDGKVVPADYTLHGGVEVRLEHFIAMAERVPDQQIAEIVANITLNKMRGRRY